MPIKSTLFTFAAASLLAVSVANADTLELADGTLLEGDLVGSSNGIIMFNTGDSIEAYPESEVVGIYLSDGVATRQQEQQQQPKTITVAEGTRLVIRMSETIDTKRHSAGHRFRGQLESALVVNGVTVARRGTTVYGRILGASLKGLAPVQGPLPPARRRQTSFGPLIFFDGFLPANATLPRLPRYTNATR